MYLAVPPGIFMDGIKSPFARHVLMHERETSYRFARVSGEKKTLSEINGAISLRIADLPHGKVSSKLSIALVVASISPPHNAGCNLDVEYCVLVCADDRSGNAGQDEDGKADDVNGLFHGYFSRMIMPMMAKKAVRKSMFSNKEKFTA